MQTVFFGEASDVTKAGLYFCHFTFSKILRKIIFKNDNIKIQV